MYAVCNFQFRLTYNYVKSAPVCCIYEPMTISIKGHEQAMLLVNNQLI